MLKNFASKQLTGIFKNPPFLQYILPDSFLSSEKYFSLSHLSAGTSVIPSIPSARSLQYSSGLFAPLGKRQLMPTIAMSPFLSAKARELLREAGAAGLSFA